MTDRVPLRLRLALWYGLLLAVALVAFAVLLQAGLRWRLESTYDDQLAGQAALVLATLHVEDDEPLEDDDPGDIFAEVGPAEEEYLVRLVEPGGTTLAERGSGTGQVAVDRDVLAQVLAGERVYTSTSVPPDVHLRMLSVPVQGEDGGPPIAMLQVGLDRGDLDETLGALRLALIVLVPLVVLAAIGGGYVLAGRALRPLGRITDLARATGARDLHARLRLDLPDDELGRLASTFDAMLDRIEEAFERQRRFTSDAAHELRTPLSLLRSQVDLALARPRSPGEYQAALQGLDTDIARMTSLVETLLALARLEGTATSGWAAFDLGETLAATLDQYGPTIAAAGLRLEQRVQPVQVAADEDLVIQVVINLLDNAIANTPAGGVITVASGVEGARAWVTVADTGRGIPEADRERVFDRFYRVDQGRARAGGGAGLGLAICKAIVEAHGGEITIASEVGIGTKVRFTLPSSAA